MGFLLEFVHHSYREEKHAVELLSPLRYSPAPSEQHPAQLLPPLGCPRLPHQQPPSSIWATHKTKPSLAKHLSKRCPSSVQAPRNLSKRTFHPKNTPVIIVSPGRRNVPELLLYNIRRVFRTHFRTKSTSLTPSPLQLPRAHLEFYA